MCYHRLPNTAYKQLPHAFQVIRNNMIAILCFLVAASGYSLVGNPAGES